MSRKLVELFDQMRLRRQFGFFDDFEWYISPHRWTSTLTDSGSATITTDPCGVLAVAPSDGTVADNDEGYVLTTNSPFKFQNEKPLLGASRLQFTEANADDANVMFGFMNAVAANAIVDDGAGPKASFSGAVIYKVDGGTVWRCRSSVGTGYIDSISTTTAGGASYQDLRIEGTPVNSTQIELTYFVNNAVLLDSTWNKPIKHLLTYTGAAAMMLFSGVKNGGANLETLNIDYMAAAHLR